MLFLGRLLLFLWLACCCTEPLVAVVLAVPPPIDALLATERAAGLPCCWALAFCTFVLVAPETEFCLLATVP